MHRTDDILIMGGSIVGSMAAAWFRRALPGQRVAVIDPGETKLPIVGESLVEISTDFMLKIGLGRHLVEEQLPKYGLTFYYKLNPGDPSDDRYFVDPISTNPILPSFLINRDTFDRALRRLNRDRGVERVDGRVTGFELANGGRGNGAGGRANGEIHRVEVRMADGSTQTRTARWLVDATGRRRLIGRRLGLTRRSNRQRSSFWFRLADFDPGTLDRIDGFTRVPHPPDYYYSAHHFFGDGNWVWLIPLRDEGGGRLMSVGITYHPDHFPDPVTSVDGFLDRMGGEHPVLGDLVRSGRIVDTQLYRNYAYRSRQRYSADGWFLIGDAADTVDPLYSSGLAMSAVGIQQAAAMMQRDLEGGCCPKAVGDMDAVFGHLQTESARQVSRLYAVTGDAYQCHLHMHLHITNFFHLVVPMLFSGYHADEAGAAFMTAMGRSGDEASRQLADLRALIARTAAARSSSRSEARSSSRSAPGPQFRLPDCFRQVQSRFALNHAWFGALDETRIPRSLSEMFLHFAGLRLRLLRALGPRAFLDPAQAAGLLRSLAAAAVTGAFGKRSLKGSALVRRLVERQVRKADRMMAKAEMPERSAGMPDKPSAAAAEPSNGMPSAAKGPPEEPGPLIGPAAAPGRGAGMPR